MSRRRRGKESIRSLRQDVKTARRGVEKGSMNRQPKLFKGAPRKKRETLLHSESQEQTAVIQWCRYSARLQTDPRLRDALNWVHSIPNGADVTPGHRARLCREGLTAG